MTLIQNVPPIFVLEVIICILKHGASLEKVSGLHFVC